RTIGQKSNLFAWTLEGSKFSSFTQVNIENGVTVMSRVMTKSIFSLAVLLFIGLSASSAYADGIVFAGADPCFPAGVGRGCGPDRSPHVLTLQNHPTEIGSVGRSTSSSGDVRTGDWQRGSNTQTVSLSQIGTTNAGNIAIFFDINEPNGGN